MANHSIESAALRILRAKMANASVSRRLREHTRGMKDLSLLASDNVYHELREEANLAKANVQVAQIAFDAMQANPPSDS